MTAAPAVLVVPSLINRYYVLDLLSERSFLRHLASRGLRPLVVDWGSPGADEIAARSRRLRRCVSTAPLPRGAIGREAARGDRLLHGRPARAGIGAAPAASARLPRAAGDARGIFTPSARRRGTAPRPFRRRSAGSRSSARRCRSTSSRACFFCSIRFSPSANSSALPGSIRRATRPATLSRSKTGSMTGCRLPLAVARECLRSWYGDNAPGQRGMAGRTAGRSAAALRRPALVVIPGRDRIVPPGSAEPLAAAHPRRRSAASAARPCRHDVGRAAPEMLWTPLAAWLRGASSASA